MDDAAKFTAGFGVGFYEGGVSLVESAQSAAVFIARNNRFVVAYETFTGQRYRHDKQVLTTAYKAVKPLTDFWFEWRTRQLADVFNAPNAAEAAMDAASQDFRMFALLTKELIIWLEQLDANATPYDRGKLQGRVAFEAATLILGEIKVAQLTKVTKITFLEKLSAKLQGSSFPRAAKAVEATTEALNTARQFSRTGRYGDLSGSTTAGHQANHLNQNAAFRPRPGDPPEAPRIPEPDGIAHEILGDAIRGPGTPHWKFHRSLEEFWDDFRIEGRPRFGDTPTCGEYSQALSKALRDAAIPDAEVSHLVALARQNREAFGLTDADFVPRVPRKFWQQAQF